MPGTSPGKSQDDLVLFTEAAANLFAAPDLGERPQSEVADAPNPRGQCLSWVDTGRSRRWEPVKVPHTGPSFDSE